MHFRLWEELPQRLDDFLRNLSISGLDERICGVSIYSRWSCFLTNNWGNLPQLTTSTSNDNYIVLSKRFGNTIMFQSNSLIHHSYLIEKLSENFSSEFHENI